MEETNTNSCPDTQLVESPIPADQVDLVNIRYFMYRGLLQLGDKPDSDNDKEVHGWNRNKQKVMNCLFRLNTDCAKHLRGKSKEYKDANRKQYYWEQRLFIEKRERKDVPKSFKRGQ